MGNQSLPVLEKKIKETEERLATAKQRYERIGQQLNEPHRQRQMLQAEIIVEALNKTSTFQKLAHKDPS